MKTLAVTTVLVLALAGFVLARPQLSTPKAPSTAQTLQQIERDWVAAAKAGDAEKVGSYLAEDWEDIQPDGTRQTKQGEMADLKSGAMKLDSIELGPMYVKVMGNVAVVQGSDTEKSSYKDKDTSGKWVWMDVFEKQGGNWLAVRSQEAMVTK